MMANRRRVERSPPKFPPELWIQVANAQCARNDWFGVWKLSRCNEYMSRICEHCIQVYWPSWSWDDVMANVISSLISAGAWDDLQYVYKNTRWLVPAWFVLIGRGFRLNLTYDHNFNYTMLMVVLNVNDKSLRCQILKRLNAQGPIVVTRALIKKVVRDLDF